MQRNRLAAETSPYLLQHATNPVDWYPWSSAALARAKQENKPILLSVGYSACHWCHVMAHESFEDPATARLMNELFVNIKVDREERPDLDKIYQAAQHLITQRSGGWPLTLFLTPDDQQPFFGGTYFPKEARHGMPAFSDILRRVAQYFAEHPEEIRQQNAHLARALAALVPQRPGHVLLGPLPLHAARRALEAAFDTRSGGFGRAPKFPHAGSIERCLRAWSATARDAEPDLKALYMATLTLMRMAEGGIYDQLGGGFYRYSVDDVWMIPHFEKMLYDSAQLLTVYAQASLATGEAVFARVTQETADWMLRDMHSPEGGFYSSLDADSAGHEGRFYVWSTDEVLAALTPDEYAVFARRFGLDQSANFEGRWHLHARTAVESLAAPDGDPAAARAIDAAHTLEAALTLDAARAKLLAARNARVWPARDEKLLTSWNALTIKGLALAARVLDRPDLADAATAAVDFIRHTLWRDSRLLATYKDGHAHLPAYLDDYAFLADALLELLQTRWRSSDLEFAQALLDAMLARFEDPVGGGFYFTASDHERLIHRSKTFDDDSLPSGNGIAASVLCRMGYLLGNLDYIAAAERALETASQSLLDHSLSHMSLLNALEDFLESTEILIIRGEAAGAQAWSRALGAFSAPGRMLFAIPNDAVLPPPLADKRAGAETVAYLCTGMTCSAPLSSLAAVSARLASTAARGSRPDGV
jgi:uncharacterized protein YyaL (SSP411 family)